MEKEFNFVEVNSQSIYDTVLDNLMDHTNEPLYPGDERRIFAEALIMVLVGVYNRMNDTARQKTLQYARGEVLDAIGDMEKTPRLQPQHAQATIRFSVQEPMNKNIVIPKNTKVTPDGEVYFETLSSKVLQAGQMYVDIEAHCQIAGSDYNGFEQGSVNTLVDVIPYIYSVSNIDITYGGDDGEPYDDDGDDRYRERIKLAHSSYSVAGSVAAYKYHTLSADPHISDVQVDSPDGGIVNIYVLMEGGNIPDNETLKKITDIISADDVRPMTDKVTVTAPSQMEYGIELKYYCTLDNEPLAVHTVESEGGAVDLYNIWQTEAMGRDINPDQLKKHILAPIDGSYAVDRVDIISPTFRELEKMQVAKFNGTLSITHEVKK